MHPDRSKHPERVPTMAAAQVTWTGGFSEHDQEVASGRRKTDTNPKAGLYVGCNWMEFYDTSDKPIPFRVHSVDGKKSGNKFNNADRDLHRVPTNPWRNWFVSIQLRFEILIPWIRVSLDRGMPMDGGVCMNSRRFLWTGGGLREGRRVKRGDDVNKQDDIIGPAFVLKTQKIWTG